MPPLKKKKGKRDERKQKRERQKYAKDKAAEEFKALCEKCSQVEGYEADKLLNEFAQKGHYQRVLVDSKRGIVSGKRKAKKKQKSKTQESVWNKTMNKLTSTKPYQGGAPGLGRKQ